MIYELTGVLSQEYCKAVIVLKRASHPNILSIEGVVPNLFEACMVSKFMENGNIMVYVRKNSGVNRLELVGSDTSMI